MAINTSIEWAHAGLGRGASWNPIRARIPSPLAGEGGLRSKPGEGSKIGWHCTHVSEGCRFCYAERLNKRLGTGLDYKPGHEKDIEIFLDEKILLAPLKWRQPTGIFVCSMSDAFADFVSDEMLDKMLAIAALCPQHRFLWLTKRPKRMREYFEERWQGTAAFPELGIPAGAETGRRGQVEEALEIIAEKRGLLDPANDDLWTDDGAAKVYQFEWPLANCWLGFSAEDQTTYRERALEMRFLRGRGWLTFCSYEPALGPLDLSDPSLHPNWLISGGESGSQARAPLKSYFDSARDQCAAAGIAYFHKQNGEWIDADEWLERLIGNGWRGQAAEWPRPLDYEHAATLAKFSRFAYKHQSDGTTLIRVGKERAGRLLDGREHNEFPEVNP